MAPTWLTVLAWISIATALVCAGLIVLDVFVRGYRQHIWIMNVVWPLTALYSGPLGWLAYRRLGAWTALAIGASRPAQGTTGFRVRGGLATLTAGLGVRSGTWSASWWR